MPSNLLLQIGPLSVYTFGIILAAAFLLGVFLFWRAAVREGFASDPIFDLIFLSVFAALLGGRLVFIVSTGEISDPLAILRVGEGVFWAPAFLSGLTAFLLYIRRRREWSFFKLADLAAPILALGQGIGFLGAEATGYLSSTVGLPPLARLASGGWSIGVGYLGLLLILEFVRRKITTGGIVFSIYLLCAGFLTTLSEYLRETRAVAFGTDLNYFLGGVSLLAGLFGLLYLFAGSHGIPPFISRVESQLRFKLKRRRKDVTSSLRSERPSRSDETPTS